MLHREPGAAGRHRDFHGRRRMEEIGGSHCARQEIRVDIQHAGKYRQADGDSPRDRHVAIGDVPGWHCAARVVRPVGSTQGTPIDVRVISASHRNLEDQMAKGDFREDLYYRMNVVTLELPALIQRREDIPLLATRFLSQLAEKNKKNLEGFSSEAMELLVIAPWPGNVRQLLNVVEQMVALSTSPIIPAKLVQKALREKSSNIPSLVEAKGRFEREYLAQLLQITNGNVTQAARLAKRNRTEFYKLLHRHHLDPALFKSAS